MPSSSQQLDLNCVVDILIEFLEAYFHQILFLRQLYSPELFERRRLYGIAIRRARHPDLCQYIHDIVESLKRPLEQSKLQKIAMSIFPTTTTEHEPSAPDNNETQSQQSHKRGPVHERFIIQPSILYGITHNDAGTRTDRWSDTTATTAHDSLIDIEAQLRAALLKLSYCDAVLSPLPSMECSFDIIAYVESGSVDTVPDMAVESWIEEQPIKNGGDGEIEIKSRAEIYPIKSCCIENYFELQCYVEKKIVP